MEKYLINLIDKMLEKSDRDTVRISSETISWKAFREAEKIDNESYIQQLIEFIETEKNKEKRDSAYFVLGHIAKNIKNEEATNFLIQRIEKEKDKYVISSLLERIQYLEKSEKIDISPIINATKSSNWNIRQSAISALSNSKSSLAENVLLDIINNSDDEYNLFYANRSLSSVGTRKSIPSLQKLLDHKKQDVSGTALNAILEISNQTDLPIFIEQLQKGKNKFTALLGVIKYGNSLVIPNIIKRVKELVAKKRTIQVIGTKQKTEIIFAMEFLSEYAKENELIIKTYELLTTTKNDFLWLNEQEWLTENAVKFARN